MKLSELFRGKPDIEVSGLAIDSRKVQPGDIFFCIKGLETDGHLYIDKACHAGAVAIIYTDDVENFIHGVVYIKVKDMLKEVNRVCSLFEGKPSRKLKVFGITGTNGKTTTASIIRDVYSGYKPCGYMGTIAVRYGNVSKIPSLTTPDQVELYGHLRDMVDAGMKAVAMEVSSHGLSMGRVSNVDFDYGIFTNLTYDHLDYHKTMENYFEAKKILFRNLKKSGVAVLNADDKSFDELKQVCKCRIISYGIENDADYRGEEINLRTDGTDFVLNIKGITYPVRTNLVARYNIYNLLSAIAAMHDSGMKIDKIIEAVSCITQVDGRMERIEMGQPFNVIVDYAHTPDGFEKIFEYAKEITPKTGKIYAVFGSAGKRDKAKRKVLGNIAGKYCEKVFITEEDPRTESAADIGAEILSGVEKENGIFIENRYEAISACIHDARKDDCVLILGKGDESYMYYAEGRKPWMGDQNAAKEVLNKLFN